MTAADLTTLLDWLTDEIVALESSDLNAGGLLEVSAEAQP